VPDRKRQLLRRGSVPLALHGLIEYGIGVLTVAAPFVFDFDDDLAIAIAIVMGTLIVIFGLATQAPTGVFRTLPLDSHIVLDYVIALILVIAPFVAGFTGDHAALAYFLIIGVGYGALTIVTRFHKPA
jgi:hypothetical protein